MCLKTIQNAVKPIFWNTINQLLYKASLSLSLSLYYIYIYIYTHALFNMDKTFSSFSSSIFFFNLFKYVFRNTIQTALKPSFLNTINLGFMPKEYVVFVELYFQMYTSNCLVKLLDCIFFFLFRNPNAWSMVRWKRDEDSGIGVGGDH